MDIVKQEQDVFFTSADKERMINEMSRHCDAGFSKCNVLSGEGFATDQWLRNMGAEEGAEVCSVMGHWNSVAPDDRQTLLSDYQAVKAGLCNGVRREIMVGNGDSWRKVSFCMQLADYRPDEGVISVTSYAVAIPQSKEMLTQLGDSFQGCSRIVLPQNEALLGSLSSALIYIDTDYTVRWSTIQALKGLGPLQAGTKYKVGEKCYKSVFGRDEPCEKCSFGQMLRSGKRHVGQFDDESGYVIEISAHPVFDSERRLVGGLLQLEDATSRITQQRRITELNRTMEAILNSTPVYIFVKNPNDGFRYIYWNKAMADYTKIPVDKVLGRTDHEVFPRRKDADKFHDDDMRLLETGESIEFQEEYVDADGCRRVVNTLKTTIPVDEELPWLLGVSWDITELKNTEAELIKAKEKAEESDKFKSMFLANMSHEIRTPLHAIVGFSELLLDDTLDNDEKQEYVSIIKTNTALLLQLVSDILDLSRIESQDLEYNYRDVDINMLCNRVAMTSCMQNKCVVPVTFDTASPAYIVNCDENRVQQVITNFVNNAVKFTHDGSITISYRLLDSAEIEIAVTDTGEGIPADKIEAIFGRFIKLNSFVQGTGLGLAICKNLVEQMGGRIGVESCDGQGSRFWFTLPYGESVAAGKLPGS